MRTLRFSLAGAVILGLLASMSTAVVAQEEEREAPTATYVTGGEVGGGNFGGHREWDVAGILRQQTGIVREMEWSDPRLPSRMLERMTWDEHVGTHPEAPVEANAWTSTYRLEDAYGVWTGTGRSLSWRQLERSEGPGFTQTILVVLTGEGAYEGLTASLVRQAHMSLVGEDIEGEIGPYEGFIFEGELPPFPDPIEPASE